MKFLTNTYLIRSTALIALSLGLTGCPDNADNDKGSNKSNTTVSQSKEALPFAGELEQIDGVLFAYTIRHPRLINEDYEALIKEIPEAAMAKMLLSQLVPFGYPQFTEIEGETNLGLFVIADSMEEIEDGPAIVIAGKIKENGKIWNALAANTVHKTHEGWTLISKDEEMLDRVKNPDALIAYLQKNQEADVKAFLRFDEKIVIDIERKIKKELTESLNDNDSLSAEERKAIKDYVEILVNQVKQIHSLSYSADLQDKQAQIKGSVQFKPESVWGTFACYPSTQDAPQAKYLSDDALLTFLARYNPYGIDYLNKQIMSELMSVNYAPAKDWLTSLDSMYEGMAKKSVGTSFGTMDIIPDVNNKKQPVKVELIAVSPGSYTAEEMRQYMKSYVSSLNDLVKNFIARVSDDEKKSDIFTYTYAENVAKVENISFDAFGISIKDNSETISQEVYLFGVAPDGSFIMSMETPRFDKNQEVKESTAEAVLAKKLPAYLNKTESSNSLYKAFPLKDNEIGSMHINGDKIVDIVLGAIKDPLTDEDTLATITSFKDKYKKSGPISVDISAEQAKITSTVNIPYSFVSNSISFGQYIMGKRFNFLDIPFMGSSYDDDNFYDDGSYDDETDVDAIIEQYDEDDEPTIMIGTDR